MLYRLLISSRRIWRLAQRISPTRFIAAAFVLLILAGAGLLMLPAASRSGVSCGFLPALFTAASASCVTGLVLFDTYLQWSGFGQTVILLLIQIGGLGCMSIASIWLFCLHKRISIHQRMILAQAMSLNDIEGVVRIQRHVLIGTFGAELTGAIVLTLRFLPSYGIVRAIRWGVFHAVSAFCNAGFDILGCLKPGGSMAPFAEDPVVLGTLMALIIVGGLGFFVWEDILSAKSLRRLKPYSKLVLLASVILVLGGCCMICLTEWNNPLTLGILPWPQKLLAALFQSVTTRTAGFAAMDQGAMSDGGKAISIILMLIGGSSGSTAGGMKTVTAVILALYTWRRARGKEHITIFQRTVPSRQVGDAVAIGVLMICFGFLGGLFVTVNAGVGFVDALFESVSALATVGLTTGLTAMLPAASQLLMVLYMFFGRVGILTLSLGFLIGNRAEERYRCAEGNFLIG